MSLIRSYLSRYGLPLVMCLVLAGFYGRTLAPDLTWANAGVDGGDLITAAATRGVAHPSGYPTYLIVARLFQFLPIGSLAFRTNLLSAVSGVVAALLVSAIVVRSGPGRPETRRWAGFLAGLGFGLSPLLWSQAVITEVYALHAALTALILWALVARFQSPQPWLECLGGLACGLALGNHLTSLLLLPPWLLGGLRIGGGEQPADEAHDGWITRPVLTRLARRVGWLGLGLSVYLLLPLRAHSGSPLNWGNPVDLEGFWWLVSGRLYQARLLNLSSELVLARLVQWARMVVSQYSFIGLVIGLVALVTPARSSRWISWGMVYVFLGYSVFAIEYDTPDSYVLLIPAFLVLGVWFGWGSVVLLEGAKHLQTQRWVLPLCLIFLAGMVLANAWLHLPGVDASQDRRAIEFGRQIIAEAPPNAIIVAREDEDTFTLWYYHYAQGERPDLVVINSGSLVYPWYRARMQAIYPNITLKDHHNCYECMLEDLTSLNDRPVCETYWDDLFPLVCKP